MSTLKTKSVQFEDVLILYVIDILDPKQVHRYKVYTYPSMVSTVSSSVVLIS